MKILHVIGTLDSSYGGPVEGLKNIASALAKQKHHIEIATLDNKDALNIISIPNIRIHSLGPSFGKYRFSFKLLPWLSRNIQKYNVVICHGIWQYQSFAIWRATQKVKIPYFIFVHGALDPWFKDTYPLKHFKKMLYWPWAEYNALRSANGVLYTTEEEKRLAPKSFSLKGTQGIVVNYGIAQPSGAPESEKESFYSTYPELSGKKIILFLSRIHPKKGCDFLIEAFAKVSKNDSSLQLVMAGPDQDNFQAKLIARATQLGINERITWTGMLTGEKKWGAFRVADVFILPSHSENFGVVLAEALSCQLPVLITNKINIWREIEKDNAGIVDDDSLDGTIRMLETWLSMPEEQKNKMRTNALSCFSQHFHIDKVASDFAKLLQAHIS